MNELELKIEASNNVLFEYEKELKHLENINSNLNYEYNISFKVFDYSKELLNYRQNILDNIGQNNYRINILNKSIKKQNLIHVLLTNCYYKIDNLVNELINK